MSKVLGVIYSRGYHIEFRQAKHSDIPKIGEMVYSRVFPEILPDESLELETDRWLGRYEKFPEGVFIAEDTSNGRIVAAHGAQIINWSYPDKVPPWKVLTDNGTIRRTHIPNGNTQQVVSNLVDREYAALGLGIGTYLLGFPIEMFRASGRRFMIVGHTLGRATQDEFEKFKAYLGNVSSLDDHRLETKLEEWAKQLRRNPKTHAEEPVDSLTRFFHRSGFRFVTLLRNFENYPDYNYCILQAIIK